VNVAYPQLSDLLICSGHYAASSTRSGRVHSLSSVIRGDDAFFPNDFGEDVVVVVVVVVVCRQVC